MTLVEVMVASAITGIILAGVATVLIATTRISRGSLVRTSNSRELRGASEVITASLRVAVVPPGGTTALVYAKPNSVSFYAMLNRTGSAPSSTLPPTLVAYWWDSTTKCLMQQRNLGVPISPTPATGLQHTFTSGTQTQCVSKTTQMPTFSYFTTSATSTALSNSSTGLAAATLPTVHSVQLQLTVQSPTNTDISGSSVLDRVALTNVP